MGVGRDLMLVGLGRPSIRLELWETPDQERDLPAQRLGAWSTGHRDSLFCVDCRPVDGDLRVLTGGGQEDCTAHLFLGLHACGDPLAGDSLPPLDSALSIRTKGSVRALKWVDPQVVLAATLPPFSTQPTTSMWCQA